MSEKFQQFLLNLVEELKEKLKQVRGYRVSLSWLQEFTLIAYNQKMPLKGVCHIAQLDPLTFRLEPWDENILPEIERALRTSGVSLQVYREGKSILVKFPPLTEELKKQLLKSLHQLKEEFRIQARQKRDEFLKTLRRQKENGEITEDDFYREKEKIDQAIEDFNQKVEELFLEKEKEIL